MLSKIKLYLYAIGAAAWAALMVWANMRGRQSERDRQARRRVDAMNEAKGIRHEVQGSDDKRLVDILTGRVRD